MEERVRASMVGTSVGAEVFHIGSPSDQTGSETGSDYFPSVRSRSTHSLSHPTTSPVSFGSYWVTFCCGECCSCRSCELSRIDVR